MRPATSIRFLILSGLFLLPLAAQAELVRWQIDRREPYANGKSHGASGPYEAWTGTLHFALDPNQAANQSLVDLKLAPKNAAGKVEFSADFRLLVPVDLQKANGTVFYEVNNRGNPTAPR